MAFSENFLAGYTCSRSPEQARWLQLACLDSQSQRVIWVILPACGASHIIKSDMAMACNEIINPSGLMNIECCFQRDMLLSLNAI